MVVGVLNFMSIYTVSIKSGLRKVTQWMDSIEPTLTHGAFTTPKCGPQNGRTQEWDVYGGNYATQYEWYVWLCYRYDIKLYTISFIITMQQSLIGTISRNEWNGLIMQTDISLEMPNLTRLAEMVQLCGMRIFNPVNWTNWGKWKH